MLFCLLSLLGTGCRLLLLHSKLYSWQSCQCRHSQDSRRLWVWRYSWARYFILESLIWAVPGMVHQMVGSSLTSGKNSKTRGNLFRVVIKDVLQLKYSLVNETPSSISPLCLGQSLCRGCLAASWIWQPALAVCNPCDHWVTRALWSFPAPLFGVHFMAPVVLRVAWFCTLLTRT